MIFDEILQIVIAGGAMFCLHDALQGAFINNKTPYGRAAGTLSFCGAVFLLFAYFAIGGYLFEPAYTNYYYIVALFVLGPATYVFFVGSVNAEYKIDRVRMLRYVPGVLVLFGFPVLYYTGVYTFNRHPLMYFQDGSVELGDYLFIGSLLHNFIYYFLIYRKSRHIFDVRATKNSEAARIFIWIFGLTTLIGTFAILAFPLQEVYLLYLACFFTSVLVVTSSLLHKKHPELFEQFGLVIERAAYKNSQLHDVDLEALEEHLRRLMETEKIFTQEEISVRGLAEILDLKPYQLTEYLNVHQNTNFSQYINKYRVEEAAYIITSQDNVNILSAAYHVGFNSKATFNLVFRKIKGCSPSEYIRQNKQKVKVG